MLIRHVLPALLLATAGEAQKGRASTVATWGQCSGSGFTGPTACAKGTYCKFGNPWYSQCLPGEADVPFDGTLDAPLDGPIATSTKRTVVTIGPSNRPTLVTTVITFLTPVSPTQPPVYYPPQQGGPPSVTVIAGTTYTLVQDPPYNGNRRRSPGPTAEGGRGPVGMRAAPTPRATGHVMEIS